MLAAGELNLSLSEIGENYSTARTRYREDEGYSLAILFRFLTGTFKITAIVCGTFFLKKLPKSFKIALLFYILFDVLVNGISQGTQKNIGDIAIYLGVVGMTKFGSLSRKMKKRIIIGLLIVALLAMTYVSLNQMQRYAAINVTAENYGEKTLNRMYYDTDHLVFKLLGKDFGFGFASALSYISAGYYGLSLCLKLPFRWTYGIGGCPVMSKLVERLTGTDLYDDTYLGRMEARFGRKGANAWNSVFPWLASDMTFIGVLFFSIFIGALFGMTWSEVQRYKNGLSLLMLSVLTLGLIFVPCNNQLFAGIDSFVSTWAITIIWFFLHRHLNIPYDQRDKSLSLQEE
jgi:hypothetical protein